MFSYHPWLTQSSQKPHDRWGKWGMKRLTDLTAVTQKTGREEKDPGRFGILAVIWIFRYLRDLSSPWDGPGNPRLLLPQKGTENQFKGPQPLVLDRCSSSTSANFLDSVYSLGLTLSTCFSIPDTPPRKQSPHPHIQGGKFAPQLQARPLESVKYVF